MDVTALGVGSTHVGTHVADIRMVVIGREGRVGGGV